MTNINNKIRSQILDGKLEFVGNKILTRYAHKADDIKSCWNALWFNYLNDNSTSSPYWYDRLERKLFNELIRLLSVHGWVINTVIPNRNWAEMTINHKKIMEFVTEDELLDVKAKMKYHRYKQDDEYSESRAAKLTVQNGKVRETGLIRYGFRDAGNSLFSYDMSTLNSYEEAVKLNLTKSMTKLREKYPKMVRNIASYDDVAVNVYDYHKENEDKLFKTGNSFNDSRGRAISQCQKKLANPISSKDFRASLVDVSGVHGTNGLMEAESVFLFIAELSSTFMPGTGTVINKAQAGKMAYVDNTFHSLDLSNEDDRKDLHENVWLERLYKELDRFFDVKSVDERLVKVSNEANYQNGFQWTVPIELDATASLAQYMGLLLSHKPILEATNIIGDILEDAWYIHKVPRKLVKSALTPLLYGSSATLEQLWDGQKYTKTHIATINKELASGRFAVLNRFKQFIIKNCNPKPEMLVNIAGEEFTIQCNKFLNVGEVTKTYIMYDSKSKENKAIIHTTTKRVPDLKQFKRYFVTLLIHNLDSKVADYIAKEVYKDYGFCIPIHDAIVCNPAAAYAVRQAYRECLLEIHENRNEILKDYFKSIGITKSAQQDWEELKSYVVPLEGDNVINLMALK